MKFIYSKEFVRYLLTGGVAAAMNFLSRIILNFWFNFSISIGIAYLIGMVTAYILKRKYVFIGTNRPIIISIVFFILINIISVVQIWAVSMIIILYILPYFEIVNMSYEIAHAFGILSTVFTTYFGHKYLSFKQT